MSNPTENVPRETVTRVRRRRSNAKPDGFQEFEQLVRDILDGQDVSYFEWLHKKHQDVVLEFNLSNKEEIAGLAREGE